jgi:hypothetical protein
MMPEALPLARDGDGNVLHGVRTPWVTVPSATYVPHSTARPGSCVPAAHAPYSDPAMVADLIAHMQPFTVAELRHRYGTVEAYLERFEQAARALAAERWLLEGDIAELVTWKRDHGGHWE